MTGGLFILSYVADKVLHLARFKTIDDNMIALFVNSYDADMDFNVGDKFFLCEDEVEITEISIAFGENPDRLPIGYKGVLLVKTSQKNIEAIKSSFVEGNSFKDGNGINKITKKSK
jgi:hypothetical protein